MQCVALQGKHAARVLPAADRFCACGRGRVLRSLSAGGCHLRLGAPRLRVREGSAVSVCGRVPSAAGSSHACGRGKSTHRSPRAADGKPYAESAFSAAICPARDKVPRRTDFSLRRAPPYFLSTGQENVREPHSPRLFFAQTVKRYACGFFFVLFLCGKKKNKDFPLLEKGKRCSFLRKEKRTKRFTEASASDSHPAADSRVHTAPGMTDSRVFRVRRHSPCGCRPRLIGLRLRARGKGKPSQKKKKNGRIRVRFSFISFRKGGRLRRRVPAGCRHAR